MGDPIYRIPAGPMLLSVASLKREHKYKGVDTVIGALPQILAALPEVRYVVAGAGEDRARLERMALSLGVRDRVTFAGEVSDEELANLYRACAVFVLPSRASKGTSKRLLVSSFRGAGGDEESRVSRIFRSRFLNALGMARSGKGSQETSGDEGRSEGAAQGEGFGRVYVEAALAGKPVVGSIDGGAAEAVIDGRTGLLVDPRSTGQVAAAVIRLLESPDWAASLGAGGRRWAREQFSVAAMREALEGVVTSVVRGSLSVVGGPSCGQVHSEVAGLPGLATDKGQLTTDS